MPSSKNAGAAAPMCEASTVTSAVYAVGAQAIASASSHGHDRDFHRNVTAPAYHAHHRAPAAIYP
jgi:hypothetical protein